MNPRPSGLQRALNRGLVFQTFNYLLLGLLAVVTLYPVWNTVIVSFNQSTDTIRGGLFLWPRVPTLKNYQTVFDNEILLNAFFISVARTVLSTAINLLLTSMLAYVLSRKEFVFRRLFTVIMVLTMYVNAGLIPQYFLVKSLGLVNNFWVYVVPGMISAFNFILVRTYITTIPDSMAESARIDGAGDLRIFFQIILPLIKPVLATVALFVAVSNWNSWFDTMLYASSRQDLSTLQYELMRILSSSMSQSKSAAEVGAMGLSKDAGSTLVSPISIRAAITMVAAIPILVVYPFLQKYFVTGLTVGGVKE